MISCKPKEGCNSKRVVLFLFKFLFPPVFDVVVFRLVVFCCCIVDESLRNWLNVLLTNQQKEL